MCIDIRDHFPLVEEQSSMGIGYHFPFIESESEEETEVETSTIHLNDTVFKVNAELEIIPVEVSSVNMNNDVTHYTEFDIHRVGRHRWAKKNQAFFKKLSEAIDYVDSRSEPADRRRPSIGLKTKVGVEIRCGDIWKNRQDSSYNLFVISSQGKATMLSARKLKSGVWRCSEQAVPDTMALPDELGSAFDLSDTIPLEVLTEFNYYGYNYLNPYYKALLSVEACIRKGYYKDISDFGPCPDEYGANWWTKRTLESDINSMILGYRDTRKFTDEDMITIAGWYNTSAYGRIDLETVLLTW